jgi:hypothetical protein
MIFKFIRNRKAFKFGKKAANIIFGDLDHFWVTEVVPAQERFLRVFENQLKTIFDEPRHDPRLVLKSEWIIFEEHLENFLGEMRARVNISTYKWDDILDQNLRQLIDKHLDKKFLQLDNEMRLEASAKLPAAIDEIEERERKLA